MHEQVTEQTELVSLPADSPSVGAMADWRTENLALSERSLHSDKARDTCFENTNILLNLLQLLIKQKMH